MAASCYRIDDLTIDGGARLVSRRGHPIAIGGLTFDFFVALIEAAPNVATFDYLAMRVWNGRAVSPETIAQRASMLRRALADNVDRGDYFEAVRGIGFRLTVSAKAVSAPAVASAAPQSIAVLPFENLSVTEDQAHFTDGLVEDITTALSQIPQLLVVSRKAAFALKDPKTDPAEAARRLGVRHLLCGSVRRAGGSVRVTAQLVDAAGGQNVWTKKYDRKITEIFTVQDELTEEIVAALDIKIVSGEQGRHRRSKVRDPESAEILYRGMHEFYKYEKSAGLAARVYFEDFVRREPDSVLGYVWLAMAWSFSMVVGWERAASAIPRVRDYADKALSIEHDDPQALSRKAMCNVLEGDFDAAIASAERATRISPNLDDAWFILGWAQLMAGDAFSAIDSQKRAMRLCPIMHALQFGQLATAYRNAGRYDDSIETFSKCLEQFPSFIYAEVGRAVAHGMKGDLDAAKNSVSAALKSDPTYTIARFTKPNLYRDKSVMENVAKVLRQAGMPDS